ncbi:CsbD family protein [Actinoallomurus purpureus]|uniref:CsbD family protein n=1 Tax=Actinoallomurus purpureus TaxID=478114 RepID=UPI00209375C6|nr:CsbD family protein [Actinoallomurus purpureus]MCO6003817.1 CsbD family protein [Actinoallomurus purpureus]
MTSPYSFVRKGEPMGLLDKLKNSMQKAKGRGKEAAGRTADDPYLESEGRRDRTAGGAKQVGEQAKDTAKEVRRTFER